MRAGQIATEAGTFVSSPFVGTFYKSPSPDADPFVEVGQKFGANRTAYHQRHCDEQQATLFPAQASAGWWIAWSIRASGDIR